MSLAINTDDVISVLLADGWHEVENKSFDLDAYEYQIYEDHFTTFSPEKNGITYEGFTFTEAGHVICGPVTSILAVRLA